MADVLKQEDKKTAHNPRKPGGFVGDFKIDRLKLFSQIRGLDAPVDLSDVWNEFNIYEDIYSPVVSGDITITDSIGMVESIPILGEEVLEFAFSTAGATPSPIPPPQISSSDLDPADAEKIIIKKFRIYKIDPPIPVSDNSRLLKLYFVSDHQITNMLSKVQRCYPVAENKTEDETAANDKVYTLADMARDIYYDFFIGSKKPIRHHSSKTEFKVEPTRDTYQMSIPNWNPFKAISFLASKAVSRNPNTGGANFVFYETLKGFRFVSIETLMLGGLERYDFMDINEAKKKYPNLDKNISIEDAKNNATAWIPVYSDNFDMSDKPTFKATYRYGPANIGESVSEASEKVTNFRLVHSFDTMKNLGMGMYSNRVITHDLIRMKIDRIDYHYREQPDSISLDGITVQKNTDNDGDLEKQQIDGAFTAEGGKICSEKADMLGRPQSHVTLVPTNKGQNSRFKDGPTTQIGIDSEGKIVATGDQTMMSPDGSNPKMVTHEKHIEDVLARRISQRRQIDSVKVEFEVPGDSAREVGDLISFDYPSENPKIASSGGIGPGHKYFSGKFLITALRHRVTQDEYTIHIEATKDGYKNDASDSFKPKPPQIQNPQGTGAVSNPAEADKLITSGVS